MTTAPQAKFKSLFEEIIQQGALRDVGSADSAEKNAEKKRRMNRRVYALANKLDSLVQRRGPELLRRDLPPKHEYVLTVRLGETQRQLYNGAMASSRSSSNHTCCDQLTRTSARNLTTRRSSTWRRRARPPGEVALLGVFGAEKRRGARRVARRPRARVDQAGRRLRARPGIALDE